MSYLQLEYFQTVLQQSLYHSTGRAYAMIFDPVTGKAVNFSSGPPYGLATFNPATQHSYSYVLTQDRLYSWSAHISGTNFALPNTDYGEYYLIEYWVEVASGVQNRTADYFVDTEKFQWLNGVRVQSRLDSSEDQLIANLCSVAAEVFTCFLCVSYDSTIQRLGFTAWLELNSQVQATPTLAIVTIYDSVGNVFINQALGTQLPAGQFVGQAINIVPQPDETYFAEIKITDVNGNVHTSGMGVVTWD